ncbi:MAG: hypothetical protein A2756_04305 [Candidatus Ryanbacteria bacterium RIFCSPHIGHO2_01_FULL_48_27]|uniref:Small-conductance mechanosensitive ion channel n=1 Tax=Candidatus Ryanbacteria bacterium RIFCSPHIGHO2_01_FULL_48_27 TaxID=1802115 RepID=A0A1G2G2T7_9BACT|nr:MAG: hypothetical protein A2756_04305 [Candidatus Ryanbacteria bacterium RIFCSPHIGHO2_01_FULL_48_27]
MTEIWAEALATSFETLSHGVLSVAPRFIVALVILLLGWLIASGIGALVSQFIKALRVDAALEGLGLKEPLSRAGMKLDSGAFIGMLVEWFFIVVFLLASVDILGLDQVTAFLRDVVLSYIPNVIVAAIILVAAAVIADATQKLVRGSAQAANLPSASFLGGVARWSIWIFALLVALYHLGIAGPLVQTLFTGFVAMIAIAGGLAFGLGGKDAAAKFIERLRNDISDR